jgi:hypothetical protein
MFKNMLIVPPDIAETALSFYGLLCGRPCKAILTVKPALYYEPLPESVWVVIFNMIRRGVSRVVGTGRVM